MNVIIFVVLALLVESIVTTIAWVVESKFDWKRVTALMVSIGLAVLTKIDLFELFGLPLALPFVGSALTGMILARGANAFYDLYRSIQNIGKNIENQNTTVMNTYQPVQDEIVGPTKEEILQKLNRRL